MQRGGELYNIFCIVCHGKQGEGDGPVIGPDRFPAAFTIIFAITTTFAPASTG